MSRSSRLFAVAFAAWACLAMTGESVHAGWWHHGCARYVSCLPHRAECSVPVCIDTSAPACAAPCVTKSWSYEPVYSNVPCTTYTTHYDIVPQTVSRTCYRPEVRQRPITTYRMVAEVRPVTRNYTVMIPETRSAVRNVPQVRYVTSSRTQTYCVAIPQYETRTAYRTQVSPRYETAYRTVCREVGHWEESCEYVSKPVYPAATCGVGGCGLGHGGLGLGHGSYGNVGLGHYGLLDRLHCRHWSAWCDPGFDACAPVCDTACEPVECGEWVTKRHYVPQTMTEQVPYTVCKYDYNQVPYTYPVTTYRHEYRTREIPVTQAVTEYLPQTYTYVVPRPEVRQTTVNCTYYNRVAETHVQSYTVQIPYTVQETVDRIVCRSVPQTTYRCMLTGYRCVEHEVPATTCATCE